MQNLKIKKIILIHVIRNKMVEPKWKIIWQFLKNLTNYKSSKNSRGGGYHGMAGKSASCGSGIPHSLQFKPWLLIHLPPDSQRQISRGQPSPWATVPTWETGKKSWLQASNRFTTEQCNTWGVNWQRPSVSPSPHLPPRHSQSFSLL